MHDEVLVGCAMLVAHPPSDEAGGGEPFEAWAWRTFSETSVAERNARGSWFCYGLQDDNASIEN